MPPSTWTTVRRSRPEWPPRVLLRLDQDEALPDEGFNELFAALGSHRDRALLRVDRRPGLGVAGELSVSLNTVKTHTRNLYAKLGTHRRAEAVTCARDLGLLAPSALSRRKDSLQ